MEKAAEPHWKSRLYRCWGSMKTRCNNPNAMSYKNYGGRGITYCKEWEQYWPFHDWALENGYEDTLTLDRIDVNGNYCPENCRWADRLQQANNTTCNRRITFDGKTMTLREWDRQLGFREGVLSDRLNTLGWDLERAMTEESKEFSRTKRYEYKGESQPLSYWADKAGITFSSMWKRVEDHGMSIEEAINKPKRGELNLLTFNGETKPLFVWAQKLEMPADTLWKRIFVSKWSVEKALTTPVRHYNRHVAVVN